tara:strand:- start:235 stop:501 length:267 start_codon:yes stop_codon:yes gene_type:complete
MTEENKTIEEQVQDEFVTLENSGETLPYVPGQSPTITISKYNRQTNSASKKKINNLLYGNTSIKGETGEPIGGNPEDNYFSTKQDQNN